MQAVILVGGLGTRLRPITFDVPKALVPLRNRPFMGYMLDFLRNGGLDGAVLSLGYLPTPIQEYLAGFDLDEFSVDYAVEDHALGTAGGIKNAARFLREEGSVVAVNGDVLAGTDLRSLIEIHRERGALATITLTSVEDPTAYGLVEVDHDMVVRRFIEKPAADEVTTNLVNAGIYVLEPEVLEMIPPGREVSIEREIFPELQAMGRLRAHVSSSYWRDIGTPRSYLAACHDVLSGAVGAPREGFEYCDVDGSVRKGKNVKLLPPVSVAAGCEVESRATVRAGARLPRGGGCRGRGQHPARGRRGRGGRRRARLDHRQGSEGRAGRYRPRTLGARRRLRRRGGKRPGPGHPGEPRRRAATPQPEILSTSAS
jgi:mannose-1-phosphate guanylyltransferase